MALIKSGHSFKNYNFEGGGKGVLIQSFIDQRRDSKEEKDYRKQANQAGTGIFVRYFEKEFNLIFHVNEYGRSKIHSCWDNNFLHLENNFDNKEENILLYC